LSKVADPLVGALLFGGATFAARYAWQAWHRPMSRTGLVPFPMWPYGAERWANALRAGAWNGSGFALLLLAGSMIKFFPSLHFVAETVFWCGGVLLWVFMFLIAVGRPRCFLSKQF
jgi:hypothetical protein